MITEVQIVTVPVKDQNKALEFYSEKLGMEVLADIHNGPFRWLQVRPQGAQTTLALLEGTPDYPAGNLKGLALTSTDFDADLAALKDKGITTIDESDNPWSKNATFSDPSGNTLVLQQMKKN